LPKLHSAEALFNRLNAKICQCPGSISIKHRGSDFIEQYSPNSIGNDVSETSARIFISDNLNRALTGSFIDQLVFGLTEPLPRSKDIQIARVLRPILLTLPPMLISVEEFRLNNRERLVICNLSDTVVVDARPTSIRSPSPNSTPEINPCSPITMHDRMLKILDHAPDPGQGKPLDQPHPVEVKPN
jgi:hypothetical protein